VQNLVNHIERLVLLEIFKSVCQNMLFHSPEKSNPHLD